MNEDLFIEVDYNQFYKNKEKIGGDVFLKGYSENKDRILSILSDGLGSGVKANVLATLTSKMALKYIANNINIKKSALIIMKTLPVCRQRKISYSTFTIVDTKKNGQTKIVEYDNPPYIYIKKNKITKIEKKRIDLKRNKYKEDFLHFSELNLEAEDRVIFFSDGVTQSGIGTKKLIFGWDIKDIENYILGLINNNPKISAKSLSEHIVQMAYLNDDYMAHDDITCGVIYFRKPRKLLIASGPSINKENDKKQVDFIDGFNGTKIIAGGTTANIYSRIKNKKLKVNLNNFIPGIPPTAKIEGINLVTEGLITLSKVAKRLEENDIHINNDINGVNQIINNLINSDFIYFLVGTKINESHQDPGIPVELEIRRTIINRIIRVLENKYLKKTFRQFI